MVQSGDDCTLLRPDLAASESAPASGDDGVLFVPPQGRGNSVTPDPDDPCIVLKENTAITAAGVSGQGDFAVTINRANAPVTEGETLVMDIDVTNNKSAEQTGVIVLEAADNTRDSEEITLSGGATDTIALKWDTIDGDAGTYTARVASGTDEDNQDVEILELDTVPSGDYGINITGSNSPVAETGVMFLEVEITNNMSSREDGNIVWTNGGEFIDSKSVNRPGGETNLIYMDWETEDGEAGTYTATVKSGTDSDTATVEVESVDNPEEKTYTVDEDDPDAFFSDRVAGDSDTGEWITGLQDIRFIECTVSYKWEGVESGDGDEIGAWALGIGSFSQTGFGDLTVLVPKNDNWGGTARFDLGSTQTGDLWGGADDGDASLTEF